MADKLVGLNQEQVQKAVTALLKFVGKQKDENNSLFDEDEFLYLVSTMHEWHACRSVYGIKTGMETRVVA